MPEKKRSAYSLLELSIVIVIISILITGAMTTAVGSISNAKVKITKDRLQIIYKALGNFVATNGRLPCPASLELLKSNANYGTSAGSQGDCSASGVVLSNVDSNLQFGMVPAVTLGLSRDLAEDGFEDKIAYVVNKNFTTSANLTASPDFSQTNFSINAVKNSTNVISVTEKSGSATTVTSNNDVFVLISYGPNKAGAYGINSATRNTSSTDLDELENDIDGISGSFNFDANFVSISRNSDVFDDIIFNASPQRLVSDFSLYNLLPCNNAAAANYTNANSSNAWFGQTIAGNFCGSTDYGKNYSKKCGPVGVWITQTTCSMPN
jgi:prepilin-type N-terminal cleavage/methylation domain-containing protein